MHSTNLHKTISVDRPVAGFFCFSLTSLHSYSPVSIIWALSLSNDIVHTKRRKRKKKQQRMCEYRPASRRSHVEMYTYALYIHKKKKITNLDLRIRWQKVNIKHAFLAWIWTCMCVLTADAHRLGAGNFFFFCIFGLHPSSHYSVCSVLLKRFWLRSQCTMNVG